MRLFGRDQLAEHHDLPVLVVEGGKCWAVAKEIPGMVAVTWNGGAKKIQLADWTPLTGREVWVWPDNDDTGLQAAAEIKRILPQAKVLSIPGDKPDKWDIADAAAEGIDLMAFIAECLATEELPPEDEEAEDSAPVGDDSFFKAPSHGLAADLLLAELGGKSIFEKWSTDASAPGFGEFFRRAGCYYEPVLNSRHAAREILERYLTEVFDRLKASSPDGEIDKVYKTAGKAFQKVRTRDFLSSSLVLFSERIAKLEVPWNVTPETFPTLTQVIDFSGSKVIARDPRPNEFFKDPVPLEAKDILQAGQCPVFDAFMGQLFPDEDTRKSAWHCAAACIANKPQKTFWIWWNSEGDGGKNTLMDFLQKILPGRMVTLKGALILYKGDKGERRFGESELRGCTAGFFDEVGGTFDIAAIKRYTSLSTIRAEAKGKDSVQFPQTWALIALCNKLPHFEPATDIAFLSRVFVLPFGSVFYANDEWRQHHIALGVEASKLHPAKDKNQLQAELLKEHAPILWALIDRYIEMRDRHQGKPFESAICQRAREDTGRTTHRGAILLRMPGTRGRGQDQLLRLARAVRVFHRQEGNHHQGGQLTHHGQIQLRLDG